MTTLNPNEPCREEVFENLKRLWGTKSHSWAESDFKFDLNNDGESNVMDSVLFGKMSEKECCALLRNSDSNTNMIYIVLAIILLYVVLK